MNTRPLVALFVDTALADINTGAFCFTEDSDLPVTLFVHSTPQAALKRTVHLGRASVIASKRLNILRPPEL